jgi:ubiquinone/menaquinone biosynthesis C-methylase UbiE
MKPLELEKQHAREQWTNDPCGSSYVRDLELGTQEFFEAVEQHRYSEYAPWMREVMEFDNFAGADLLEIGCGMGTDLLQFSRGGAHCTAVDITPRSIEITRHRFALYNQPGFFLLSDAEHLPFRSESFDVVYSNGVLHHTPDTQGSIDEVHRVLRKGGTAKIMVYHRNSLNYWVEIVARRGLLGAEFLRGRSPEEIMSRVIECSDHDARPLVKVYSRKQAMKLFRRFKDVRIEVDQLTREELRFLSPLLSQTAFRNLSRRVGWNLIITARK